ncbi:hypothetical protein [Streptomyces sp. KAU_LT]|uniref:hypothetical protein n=1 Tax=Streptomyces sp. KAU_LT TaxID=3046669 RepID=UPI0024B66331|nr:hypothetical protein [Streptomyces sp. KAU_LT]MDI9832065.1 hypothetical protein [Streptomyces sp. KAU_LT]
MQQPPDSPEALLRSTTEALARRLTQRNTPVPALTSVLELIDNDEAELALDELVRVVEYFRIPVSRAEYDQLVTAAMHLDSMDSLLETGVARFITA